MIATKMTKQTTGPQHDPAWAWAEYVPSAERPWSLPLAGHLLRRATFGWTWPTLQEAYESGPSQAVDRLIDPPAAEVESFEQTMRRDELAVARASGIDSLRAWWLLRMLRTPFPLRERMTLFWHSHFGVSNSRVNDTQLMLRHVQMLREHALGSYRQLLEAAANDPAVMLSVGAERNRKLQPNENFIRQLMEQYSVGPGHYGDEDVREAARAFTGWSVLRGRLRYLAHEHDDGTKQVLGKKGDWQADDVVRIVLDQPATPRLIARKLYQWLISEVDEPSDELLAPLADMLAKEYDVGQVVETMLRCNLFYSETAYRLRVKSPVEFALGLAKGLEASLPTLPLGTELAWLGEDLYNPPTTRGWAGGVHWINSVTMIGRHKLAESMLAPQGPYGGNLNVTEVAMRHGCTTAQEAAEWLTRLLLQDDVTRETREQLLADVPRAKVAESADWLRKCALRIAALPQFQLC